MINNLEIYFMMFIIHSICGWIMECTLGVIQKHKFVNRGFLIGPYCPIYGVGVVAGQLLLNHFVDNIALLFLLATLICGIIEYVTSYLMEKIFHARWWDYSQKKFNINGRICLETLIPFGLLSTVIISFLNPLLLDKLNMIPPNVLNYIVIGFLILYIVDSCISFTIILRFKNLTKLEKDNTEEITKRIKETAEAAIEKLKLEKEQLILFNKQVKEKFVEKSKLNRRLINAFPNVNQREYTRKRKK